ncbi:MAG: hypothetical protein K6G89_07915 [Clostridia bacterium]|nr:hypothetical protein [Clostridia bacterium]
MELQELEQFDANITERITEIKRKTDGVIGTHPIEFRGKAEKLPVIRVRIGFPVYRLNNGRTSTYQLEYLALRPDLPEDFFKRDNDAISAQKAQHEVLGELVDEENLLKAFKEEEQQVQPLICTNTGVVVNGNRRLCAWRTLYLSNPVRYKNFETIEIAVLPECDEKEITVLEEKLQIQKEKRAEYKWHAKAMMAQRREQNGTKHADVAKAFGLSPQALTILTKAMIYASKYLKTIGKTDQWSLVDNDYYAFEKLVKNIKNFTNQGDQELFETLVFNMISQGSTSGRLYDVIDDVAKHFEALKAELAAKNNVRTEPKTPEDIEAANGSETITSAGIVAEPNSSADSETVGDGTFDLLAGEHIEEDVGSKVADTIREADEEKKKDIIKHVKRIIESEKEIKREQEAATYLINQVGKASSILRAAADQGLNEDAEIEGIQDHLDSIKRTVTIIEDWLNRK